MQKFTTHTGTAVPLRISDIDTDQIIPARFCTSTSRTGHAGSLFADWRDDPAFVLNEPARKGATILVAGNDFGTGSSREYAVWALQDYGFRVVIAPRFGDIFTGNALMNGLLTVVAPAEAVTALWEATEQDPAAEIRVDLVTRTVACGPTRFSFALDDAVRDRLLRGADLISSTLEYEAEIAAFESARRPALPTTLH